MDWIQAIEIFALVTGVIYVTLEILQKNALWIVGILSGIACAVSFAMQHVWASMGLNLYYVGVSVVGLLQWRKASAAVGENHIHLARLPKKVAVWSAVILVVGSVILMQVLRATGDAAPGLDAVAAVLSIIATWWLTQSYLQEWLLWIVADTLTAVLCLQTGQYWMAGLYVIYIFSAIYGYHHWKKNGQYIEA